MLNYLFALRPNICETCLNDDITELNEGYDVKEKEDGKSWEKTLQDCLYYASFCVSTL